MPLCNFQYENGFKTAKDILTKFDIYNKYKALSDFVQIIRSVTTFFTELKVGSWSFEGIIIYVREVDSTAVCQHCSMAVQQ